MTSESVMTPAGVGPAMRDVWSPSVLKGACDMPTTLVGSCVGAIAEKRKAVTAVTRRPQKGALPSRDKADE